MYPISRDMRPLLYWIGWLNTWTYHETYHLAGKTIYEKHEIIDRKTIYIKNIAYTLKWHSNLS